MYFNNFCDFVFFFFFFSLILYFWKSNLYSRILIFAFWYCFQFCAFKNPIFSTYFYLGARLLAWLLSPTLDSPFSPRGDLCLLPPPSLLYPTLWISLCVPDCVWLCDTMDCSMPDFLVHYQLPQFTQTHVHWVGDAISSSVVPFSSCLQSFPAPGWLF